MSATINPDSTLYDITTTWPATVPVFVSQGFPQMADEKKRQVFGRQVSLRQAIGLKKLDLESFITLLGEAVGDDGSQAAVQASHSSPIKVTGLLPCPVRIPMEEAFVAFSEELRENNDGPSLEGEFQAAAVGAGWIAEHVSSIEDPEDLPDLFISAGFETFFDPNGIGRFRHIFADRSPWTDVNPSFKDLPLKDPEGRYTIIAVVPAVFLVNTQALGDRPAPQTWAEILEPEFEQRVSLPVGDFDLFSGILLDIRRRYGDDGVRRLGRSLMEAMHPAQMVKVGKRPDPPMVTIMPYFFTRMVRPGTAMQAVWPSDGAIVSPIFLLAKDDDRVQPVVDFFCSKEMAEILAIKGLFPSAHPEVDNGLAPDAPFSWLGWDWISTADIAAEIAACQLLFDEGRNSR